MTLVELRQALVEQSGHRGLVTDAPAADYSDKAGLSTNATFYINSGIRWLDRRWTNVGAYRVWKVPLTTGQFQIDLPGAMAISRIDAVNSIGTYRVEERTIEWFRQYYGEQPNTNVTASFPAYWCRWPDNAQQIRAVNLLGNGALDYSISPWTASTGAVSWRDGVLHITTASDTGRAQYEFPRTTDITGATLSFTVVAEQDATGQFFLRLTANGASIDFPASAPPYDIDAMIVTLFDAGTYPAYTLAQLQAFASECDSFEIGYYKSGGGTLTADIDAIALTPREGGRGNIMIAPPVDAPYELTIFATFKSEDMSADADYNWWSVNAPEIVVRAARVQLELDGHRNISGMKAFKDMIEEEVARMASEHQYAYISGLATYDMVPNG